MPNIKIKIADYILVAALVAAGFVGFWFNTQQSSAAGHRYVQLFIDNQEVAEVSTAVDYVYSFSFGPQGEFDGYLEIKAGQVRMLPMSGELCPKGICSHTGWISHTYESIVCLPNRIMVIFTDQSTLDDNGLDGVTF